VTLNDLWLLFSGKLTWLTGGRDDLNLDFVRAVIICLCVEGREANGRRRGREVGRGGFATSTHDNNPKLSAKLSNKAIVTL